MSLDRKDLVANKTEPCLDGYVYEQARIGAIFIHSKTIF